jgi:hypothetical protein
MEETNMDILELIIGNMVSASFSEMLKVDTKFSHIYHKYYILK